MLGFEADRTGDAPGQVGLSQMVAEVLAAVLSGRPGLTLVDRTRLDRTLAEQAVSLGGVTDTARAVSVGRVVGAQLLVTGRAFELGESRVVTARVIGAETTRTRSVVVRGPLDTPLDAMAFEAAEALAALLAEDGHTLVAGPAPEDPVPALAAALRGRADLPVVAVVIPEEHVRAPEQPAPAPRTPRPPRTRRSRPRSSGRCSKRASRSGTRGTTPWRAGWAGTSAARPPRGRGAWRAWTWWWSVRPSARGPASWAGSASPAPGPRST